MPKLKPKPEYRYEHFKEIYNTVITLSSGMIVASVAFVASADNTTHGLAFSIGLGLLFCSVILQILILLSNVIAAGFDWDFMQSKYTNFEDHSRGQFFGKLSGAMLIVSILLTSVGFLSMWYFVSNNV